MRPLRAVTPPPMPPASPATRRRAPERPAHAPERTISWHKPSSVPGELGSDDLDHPAAVALAVELDEQHALPLTESELAVRDRDRLAGGAEEHRHAVRMALAELHVLVA